jgi:oligopeptide transport system substrate-binding protein
MSSACTPDDPEPNEPTTSATPTVSASATEVFAAGSDVLTVAIREPATLDPMRISDPGATLIARQLFEGLTAWDGIEEEVIPAAAESWDVEAGGRTFAFHLRAGMTFHDGSPVTSEDFAFAFDRIALKANASDLAYTLEDIVGFTAVNQLGDSQHLSGISTPDELTLVIHLTRPNFDFPALLTHPGLVPVPPAAVGDLNTFLRNPVGNGPFQMARPWSVGDEVVLAAYPGFIDTPELEGIRFIPYQDAAASWLQFLDDQLHVVEVPPGQIDSAEEDFGSEGYKSLLAGYYFGFNLKDRDLDSMALRRAVNRAIDREAIASTIYKGTMEPARGIVPGGMPGFQENICLRVCDYSPDAARSLVRDLPRNMRQIELEYTQGQPHGRVAKAVEEDLESVGLKVRTRSYPLGEYLRRLRDSKTNVFRLGWIAEYPVPDVFLTALFDSNSPDNHFGFASQRVDELLARARAEPSPGRHVQLYIEAEKAIMEDVPIVPIGSFSSHWAAQPDVAGIVFDNMGGFDAVGVSLEDA